MELVGDPCCDDPDCSRPLADATFRLSYIANGTERRVYECPCGGVTVTIARTTG